ncbi:M81 family metallopeptidase [Paenibacillus beijingensis]|uniref:MlrC domain protein n=1 Tax=Paenibacillus beijingensis TaxID=1126833 RepID=A0A0D5NLM0_9BACL|nr:M81 family metallopeptidase [Paenibacillus beijingensis]AJY75902.1 hypothetical protein VN24_16785 [Paenibacillus beijingensis]
MTLRILIGALVQESNTFSPYISSMDDFRSNVFLLGDQIKELQIENEVRGGIQAAEDAGVEVVPVLCAYAVSSGKFARHALKELKQLMLSQIRSAEQYDGVYFAMHGAMVAEGCDDVEGELTEEIRRVIGDLPFVLSLDLHANVTTKMIRHTDAIVGYRTYPHMDFYETGYRAVQLLISVLKEGKKPAMAMVKLPMIVPAENSQSTHGPFAELWKEAFEGEQRGISRVTSLFPVQPWLDIAEMGSSAVVVADEAEKAEREAERLAELFWQKRHDFDIRLYSVQQIVELADTYTGEEGPIVISDVADSPGAGSTGDSAFVLRQLLDLGVQERLNSLLVITDERAVEQAIQAGVGQNVELTVGHTLDRSGEPLTIAGKVRRIGDGQFRLNGGHAKNTVANMGRNVVVEIGTLSLLIGERPVFSGDPSMYRTMGLEPERADIVMVKSANQFRADYEAISKRIYILDTPGSSPADITKLSYHHIVRPFYPFDDNFEWKKLKGYTSY